MYIVVWLDHDCMTVDLRLGVGPNNTWEY
jgi:hypothetical protein